MKTFDFTTGASSSLALSQKYLTELFDQRKRVQIKEVKSKRTLSQNDLYWLWLTVIAKATFHKYGMTPNDWHNFFKNKFLSLPDVIIEINDQIYHLLKTLSTTELGKSDLFPGYLKEIELFVKIDLGNEGFIINLPHPEDLGFNELYEKYGQ